MSYEEYKNKSNNVILCTEKSDELSKLGIFNPEHYIIVDYLQNTHYKLVEYKNKSIFKFKELPFNIKEKIINRCMNNKETGIYNLIPDFNGFKLELENL